MLSHLALRLVDMHRERRDSALDEDLSLPPHGRQKITCLSCIRMSCVLRGSCFKQESLTGYGARNLLGLIATLMVGRINPILARVNGMQDQSHHAMLLLPRRQM